MAAFAGRRPAPARFWLAAGLIPAGALAAMFAVAWPLATYSVTLAAFGLPHVLSELRYVDRRFGRSLGGRRVIAMAALLAAIVAARAAGVFRWLPPDVEEPLELALVAALALTAAATAGLAPKLVAIGVAAAIGTLALADPFDAMVAFSVLHNLTPLGFLWQLAPPARRPAAMAWAGAVFLGLPLIVASGLPRQLLGALAVAPPDPLAAGPLVAQLPVYVPDSLLASGRALDLFSAAVTAQLAHYAAVIVVLPWLLGRWSPRARGLLPWPRTPVFLLAIAGLGAFAFSRFTVDFNAARGLYSLAAAFHAWVEIPLLVIALTAPQAASSRSSPKANEAALVASDTSTA